MKKNYLISRKKSLSDESHSSKNYLSLKQYLIIVEQLWQILLSKDKKSLFVQNRVGFLFLKLAH